MPEPIERFDPCRLDPPDAWSHFGLAASSDFRSMLDRLRGPDVSRYRQSDPLRDAAFLDAASNALCCLSPDDLVAAMDRAIYYNDDRLAARLLDDAPEKLGPRITEELIHMFVDAGRPVLLDALLRHAPPFERR